MAEWYCFKCKEKMEPSELQMVYLEVDGTTEGIKCPQCGASYVTEDVATDKLARAEKMIEEK